MDGSIVRAYSGPIAERFTSTHARILKAQCDHVYPYKEGGQWYVIGSRGKGESYRRLVYAHFSSYETYEVMMGFKQVSQSDYANGRYQFG